MKELALKDNTMKNKCADCQFNKPDGEACDINASLYAFDVRNKTGSIIIDCEKFKPISLLWNGNHLDRLMEKFRKHDKEKANELFSEDFLDQLLSQGTRITIKDTDFIPNKDTWTAYAESDSNLGAFVAKGLTSKQVVRIMLKLSNEIR